MQVLAVVVSQFVIAGLVRDWAWWKVWVAAYVVSGTLNQNLFCAQHEISHFLAFRKPLYNKVTPCPALLPPCCRYGCPPRVGAPLPPPTWRWFMPPRPSLGHRLPARRRCWP